MPTKDDVILNVVDAALDRQQLYYGNGSDVRTRKIYTKDGRSQLRFIIYRFKKYWMEEDIDGPLPISLTPSEAIELINETWSIRDAGFMERYYEGHRMETSRG